MTTLMRMRETEDADFVGVSGNNGASLGTNEKNPKVDIPETVTWRLIL